MSKFHRETIECRHCLNEEEIVVWDFIDTSLDPDLKEKILYKEIQSFECQNCNHRYNIEKAFLFHDKEHALLFYYQPQEEWKQITDYREKDGSISQSIQDLLPKDFGFDTSDYNMRIVLDYNSLIEKIHIADNDLSDRLMEVVKLAIHARLPELEGQGKPLSSEELAAKEKTEMHFLAQEENVFVFQCYSEELNWHQIEVDKQVYQHAENLLKNYLPQEGSWDFVDAQSASLLSQYAAEKLSQSEDV